MNITRRVVVTLCRTAALAPLLVPLLLLTPAWGNPSPFELDLKELDRQPASIPVKQEKVQQHRKRVTKIAPRKPAAKTVDADTSALRRYTVRSGDHVFRILMRELGLSNDEAERLIPTVARINDIDDIRKLSVGQVLLLPTAQTAAKRNQRQQHAAVKARGTRVENEEERLAPPVSVTEPSPEAEPAEQPATPAESHVALAAVPPEIPPVNLKPPIAAEPPPVSEPAAYVQPIAANEPSANAAPPAVAPSPVLPRYPVKVHAIDGRDSEEMIDSIVRALGLECAKMRIVEFRTGAAGGNSFSVKVDRYIENGGKRNIINSTEKDHFNYTLLRLLEQEGYRVIHAERKDFREIAGALLTYLDRVHEYTARQVEAIGEGGPKERRGFLIGDGAKDMQLFLTELDSSGT